MEPAEVDQGKSRYRLLEPARRSGLFQEVADRLREAILKGRFRPGERLREAELSAMLEVSRGPVREALARLEHEGLVITRRNRGAIVARLSKEDEEEIRSLRLALEHLAIQLAVRRATDEDLEALQSEIDHLRTALGRRTSAQEIADLEVQFHDRLCRAARHRRLYSSWLALRSQLLLLLSSRPADKQGSLAALPDRCAALLSAIRSRDEHAALAFAEGRTEALGPQPREATES